MQDRASISGGRTAVLLGLVSAVGLYVLSRYSYLLFHSLAELFSIVVACGIFIVAWNARRFLQNNYLLFIGIAYLFVAGVDLMHTLAYKGMGVFPGFATNPATELWIGARYLESLSLLAAPLFIKRKPHVTAVFLGYGLVFALLMASIFYWDVFPDSFVEGIGLTPFKKVSEYTISLILFASMGLVLKNRSEFDSGVVKLLVASILVTVASEMAFTLYTDAYGLLNMIGHYLKILSFYFIYKAIVGTGLSQPYNLLFRNLKQSEAILARQTNDLQRAYTGLEVVNKELEAFSYSVSHDLRAPLRSVEGFSKALLEDYGDKLDDHARGYVDKVCQSAGKMNELIENLLTLSHIARSDMKRGPVDLSRVARTVAAELQKSEPERRVELVIQDGVMVEGDEALLKIAMDNLMGNAWKFTGKQPVPRIEFGFAGGENGQEYFVRDNGAGFDMKYADKLFAPFQRLHGANEFPGTGIGLATVQRIIRRHGGEVRAESEAGKGATFYFTLG